MSRIEDIKAKNARLLELKLELLDCSKQAMKIVLKGASKYNAVTIRRAFQVMGWTVRAESIKTEMKVVSWQPIFKEGCAIVGKEEEIILNK